jgi:hypothetical protein
VPPGYVRLLADLSEADLHLVGGRGHDLLLEPKWRETAGLIGEWLTEKCLQISWFNLLHLEATAHIAQRY